MTFRSPCCQPGSQASRWVGKTGGDARNPFELDARRASTCCCSVSSIKVSISRKVLDTCRILPPGGPAADYGIHQRVADVRRSYRLQAPGVYGIRESSPPQVLLAQNQHMIFRCTARRHLPLIRVRFPYGSAFLPSSLPRASKSFFTVIYHLPPLPGTSPGMAA